MKERREGGVERREERLRRKGWRIFGWMERGEECENRKELEIEVVG